MTPDELLRYYHRFKYHEDVSHELMRHRVHEILLVSTFYDAFIIEQDVVLSEQISGEYSRLNLSSPPRVTSVPSGVDALSLLDKQRMDLVVTTMRTGDLPPFELASLVKQKDPKLPVLLLVNNPRDSAVIESNRSRFKSIDETFLWTGDPKVFLAMVKSVEDRLNLEHDTRFGLVRVILLVEDSIRDYSKFLPMLYSEVVKQTALLISDEVTESQRRLRMSQRPKIIVAHTYEEAEAIYREYREYLICVITDLEYERNGRKDPQAGLLLAEMIRNEGCMVPIVLQSIDQSYTSRASAIGAHFLHKESPNLLEELRNLIVSRLGFGDFVFRLEDGTEVARASTIKEFISRLRSVPDESLVYHARHNHYSGWLVAHGEVAYAKKIEPGKVTDFPDVASLRRYLVDVFAEVQKSRNRGRIVDPLSWELVGREHIVRLRGGSLGGKGRGLAFLAALLCTLDYNIRFPGIEVTLPATMIIGTDEFDEFMERNGISNDIISLSDEEIRDVFLAGELSTELKERLAGLVSNIRYPLAVRSSGLLEDSLACPFAGVYKTFMLPNFGRDPHDRFEELQAAIKLVFACMFEKSAREYIESVSLSLAEEKMAVVIQEIVGCRHGEVFYPDVSGVAQSYNFYATNPLRPENGIAAVAVGLGRTVVQGGRAYRFCPKRPDLELLQPEELLRSGQRELWAIRLNSEDMAFVASDEGTLALLPIRVAEGHGVLDHIASVWDQENNRLVDSLDRPGPRAVTFAGILKYETFPLAALLDDLLMIGEKAMGMPVEIEFAACVYRRLDAPRPAFFPLQIRPLSVERSDVDVWEGIRPEDVFIFSNEALGNGVTGGVRDVVYVDPRRFSPTDTLAIKAEIAEINRKLRAEGRHYILIGPGRWGSRDRFLGIPVAWPDISEACAIVEQDLEDFRVEASQGTHFLHNLVAMRVGYMKIRWSSRSSWIDLDYLNSLKIVNRTEHCVHVMTDNGFEIRLDGKTGVGLVRKG